MRSRRFAHGWASNCLVAVALSGLLAAPLFARPALIAIPVPATDDMDRAARAQLNEERARVEALLADTATTDADLAMALGRYGQIAFAYQQSDTAHAAFANAALFAPEAPHWFHLWGLTALESGRFDEAHAALAEALMLTEEPNTREGLDAREANATRLRLGEVNLRLGKPDAARTVFMEALAEQSEGAGAAAARFGLGRADAAEGRFEAAAEHFRATLALAPEANVAYYHLGLAYRELGRLDEARAALAKRGTITPVIPDPLFAEARRLASGAAANLLRGTRALRRGDIPAAIGFFEQAIAASSVDAQAWRGLATALDRAGRTDEAAARLQSALAGPGGETLAQDAELQLHRGILLGRLGQGAGALAAFRAAVEAAPDLRDARFNLGLALKRAGNLAESVEQLTRAVELDPADLQASLELAGALDQMGRTDDVIATLEAVRKAVSDQPRVDLELALAFGRAERFTDAAGAYDRFLAQEPGEAQAHIGRAMALLLAGDCVRAAGRLDASLQVVPDDVRLEHLLARVLATCPDPAGRDGARAYRLAQVAMNKLQTLDHGETIGMALAELGRFEDAADWQGRIVADAERQGLTDLLPALRARVAQYQRREPVRAPWRR